MGNQIEQRYLVNSFPVIPRKNKGLEIKLGWLLSSKKGIEIKLSKFGQRQFMTINESGEKRKKIEIKISEDQFEDLWKGTKGQRIRMRMFEINEAGELIIVYKFLGKHKSLITARILFTNEDKAINFKVPKWLGKNITGNRKYDFKNIAIS